MNKFARDNKWGQIDWITLFNCDTSLEFVRNVKIKAAFNLHTFCARVLMIPAGIIISRKDDSASVCVLSCLKFTPKALIYSLADRNSGMRDGISLSFSITRLRENSGVMRHISRRQYIYIYIIERTIGMRVTAVYSSRNSAKCNRHLIIIAHNYWEYT